MIDADNYSATETLRDGRTVEIRAQRGPRSHASGDRTNRAGVSFTDASR